MKKYTIPGGVIVMPEKNKNWILMNVHTREVLGVDLLSLEVLRMLENGTKPNSDLKYKVWNIGRFSNEDGLLADPSRFVRDVESWPSSELLSINKLLKLYQKMGFLVSNYDDYIDTLSYKDSFLDESKLGNFHQQLGRHLIMNKRVNPDEWWLNQKFLDDFSNTQNNLYRSIQDNYLEGYFANHLDSSMSVLDLGCGPGYYTNKIGEIVEKVVGIDPSQQFIDIANKNKSSKAEYHVMNLGKLGALDQIEDNAFDIVFMSDALLFYFVSPNPSGEYNIKNLLTDIKRVLKPNGKFINVEPHYHFFLQPWLGDIEMPFTIISEYKDKYYGITPTIGEYIKTLTDNGFNIVGMDEMMPNLKPGLENERSYGFAKQFPLWQIFEFKINYV